MKIEVEVSNRRVVAGLALLLAGGALGWGVKAVADGIPQTAPLQYAGTVLENGAAVTGMRDVVVNCGTRRWLARGRRNARRLRAGRR